MFYFVYSVVVNVNVKGRTHEIETELCTVLILITVKKIMRFLDFFDQTFQGLGLGKLFPARESLVSDILAGDGKLLNLYLQ